MLTIALHNLFQEKIKLFISIMGVAFSVLLIVVLIGVYQGINTKLGEYIETVPADLWIAQEGSKNLFDSTSILSVSSQGHIERVGGVSSVKAFNGRQITVAINGAEKRIFVVGLGGNSGAVAPKIVEGTADIKSGEIILDRSLKNAKLGQEVTVGGQAFKVAGITEGGSVLIVTYAFMNTDDATKLFKQNGVVNYFIVNVAKNANTTTVARNIETVVPGTKAMITSEFVDNTTSIVKEVFLPIMTVLAMIGMAVGITVIGLTVFTSTLEKAKEYGVLKAIGISDVQLYKIVLQQSVFTSVLGFLVGAVLGIGLTELAIKLVPEFVSSIQAKDLAILFVATIVMGTIAAVLPAHRITMIDPTEVFKG